jgi:hypothetical protein
VFVDLAISEVEEEAIHSGRAQLVWRAKGFSLGLESSEKAISATGHCVNCCATASLTEITIWVDI